MSILFTSKSDARLLLARVLEKSRREGACRVWFGHVRGDTSVPRIRFNGALLDARKAVWAATHLGVGVPNRVKVKNTCGNPLCVEPEHVTLPGIVEASEWAFTPVVCNKCNTRKVLLSVLAFQENPCPVCRGGILEPVEETRNL
ncbi:hypothetical protein [Carbonactinospora thermoautotrophica]|uniref:hypothetical protein n=1 Tax=Carbonactinospora thermoautotrophica TaxID=1469144 RepID=UPI002270C21D|nr:hypothetical protein [Carbonactinospora thermoautotrophica]